MKFTSLILLMFCLAFTINGQQAVFFSGNEQYLSFPSDRMPYGNEHRTVEFWMKSNSNPNLDSNLGRERVISFGSNTKTSGLFSIFTEIENGTTYLSFWGHNKDLYRIAVIPDSDWHFVAVTYDGRNLKCYVDGIQKYQQDIQLNTTTNVPCYIGGAPGTSWLNDYNGAIREVSIWRTARKPDQIKRDMIPYYGTTAPYRLTATEPGLVAHFPLDEGSGTSFKDLGGIIEGKVHNAQWTKALSDNPKVQDVGIWFVIQNQEDLENDTGLPAKRIALSVDDDNNVVRAPIPLDYGSDISAFLWRVIEEKDREWTIRYLINKKLGNKKVLSSQRGINPKIESKIRADRTDWWFLNSEENKLGTNVFQLTTNSLKKDRCMTTSGSSEVIESSYNSGSARKWVLQPMFLHIGYHIPHSPEHIASWNGTIATDPFSKMLKLSNGIPIYATHTVSDWALLNAHLIYNNMLNALEPARLTALGNNIPTDWRREVHIVSKYDPSETVANYPLIKEIWNEEHFESYRGSFGYDPLRKLFVTTITEEMMCKSGVHARGTDGDYHDDLQYREFDQVVHEFAHALDRGCGMNGGSTPSCFMGPNPRECYAASTQAWFNNNFSYSGFKKASGERIITRQDLKDGQASLYNYIDQGFNASNTWMPPRKLHHRELKHEIPSGTTLLPTDKAYYWSFSENYHLKLQNDGNLVVKDIGGWGSGHKWGAGNIMQVPHQGVTKAVFDNGWMKFYNAAGAEVDKFGVEAPGAFLIVKSEEPMPVANTREVAGSWIKVVDVNGHLLWPKHVMEEGDELLLYSNSDPYQFYESFSKKYRLTLNGDGRLVVKENNTQKWISSQQFQAGHGSGTATKVKFENGWIKFLNSGGSEIGKIGGHNGQDAPGACLIVCSEPVTGSAYLKIVNQQGHELWKSN